MNSIRESSITSRRVCNCRFKNFYNWHSKMKFLNVNHTLTIHQLIHPSSKVIGFHHKHYFKLCTAKSHTSAQQINLWHQNLILKGCFMGKGNFLQQYIPIRWVFCHNCYWFPQNDRSGSFVRVSTEWYKFGIFLAWWWCGDRVCEELNANVWW